MLEDMENFGQLCDYGYYRRIKIEDVKTVIHRMHKVRLTGPNRILINF